MKQLKLIIPARDSILANYEVIIIQLPKVGVINYLLPKSLVFIICQKFHSLLFGTLVNPLNPKFLIQNSFTEMTALLEYLDSLS